MSILIDTNIFIWAATGSERLTIEAREMLNDPDKIIFFSAVSAWEIAIKWSKGSLELPDDPQIFLPVALSNAGYSQLSVNLRDACAVASLPLYHKDPFDRLLIGQAMANGLSILTSDSEFKKYNVDVIWL